MCSTPTLPIPETGFEDFMQRVLGPALEQPGSASSDEESQTEDRRSKVSSKPQGGQNDAIPVFVALQIPTEPVTEPAATATSDSEATTDYKVSPPEQDGCAPEPITRAEENAQDQAEPGVENATRADTDAEAALPTDKGNEQATGFQISIDKRSERTGLLRSAAEHAELQRLDVAMGNRSNEETPPDGTGGAKPDVTMIAVEQMTDSSLGEEQNFPSDGYDGVDSEQSLPASESSDPADTTMVQALNAQESSSSLEEIVEKVEASGMSELLERTERLISVASAQVRQTDASSVSLTLKPEAGVELSLQLRLRNGSVEAQAQVSAGEFTALQSEWPQLQERLAQQGIHLAPLEQSQNSANPGNAGHRWKPPQREALEPRSFPIAVSTTQQTAANTQNQSRHDGWEVWA